MNNEFNITYSSTTGNFGEVIIFNPDNHLQHYSTIDYDVLTSFSNLDNRFVIPYPASGMWAVQIIDIGSLRPQANTQVTITVRLRKK